ncbi:hypothetical protein CYMTET_17761 [Cymbomonas tetramitiformis]|uniref:Phospholipid/glycerol acyltransferase domain-containing protein n=1 Tax=Cymbomonas tetramitiformis TaxID=36881 RepID=A0AAE0G9E9_9CHLO|nr:hypothetical protein CYMTET_17761 [Cymbomonas tetramitiformis]
MNGRINSKTNKIGTLGLSALCFNSLRTHSCKSSVRFVGNRQAELRVQVAPSSVSVHHPRHARPWAQRASACRHSLDRRAPTRAGRRCPWCVAALTRNKADPDPAEGAGGTQLRILVTQLGAFVGRIRRTLVLWGIHAYLSIFGGERGLRLLVATIFPPHIHTLFGDLFDCYKYQVVKASGGDLRAASRRTLGIFQDMTRIYAREILGTPFEFATYHEAIRQPIDYFTLGNDLVRPLIDSERSVLGQRQRWDDIQSKLQLGENVILLANHQSDVDPACISLLTEASHPGLGEKIIYVAGSRVAADFMCKPFSMGRNLLFVNSKNAAGAGDRREHIRQNLAAMRRLGSLLKAGGKLIWVAPSGGRDCLSPEGNVVPGPFDAGAVEMMRKLATEQGTPQTSLYPLAMVTHNIMPVCSDSLEEVRVVNYTQIGISLAEQVDLGPEAEWARGISKPDIKTALAQHLYANMHEEYQAIERELLEKGIQTQQP